MIQVAIVDDQALVRCGLRNLLAQTAGLKICGEAASGESGLALLKKQKVDIVLLDISLPGISGIEAIKRMLRLNPKLKIVVVTAYDNAALVKFLLTLGAKGYVSKTADAAELQQAIRTVYQGKRYIPPRIATQLANTMIGSDLAALKSPLANLTEREWQVLLMVAQGLESRPIAEKLGLKERTINTHRNEILKKLNLDNEVQLTLVALNHNLLAPPSLVQAD